MPVFTHGEPAQKNTLPGHTSKHIHLLKECIKPARGRYPFCPSSPATFSWQWHRWSQVLTALSAISWASANLSPCSTCWGLSLPLPQTLPPSMFLMLMPRCQMKEEQAVPLSPLLPEQHHQETCWGFHCNHLSDHFSTRSEPFWQRGMCGHPKGRRNRGECPAADFRAQTAPKARGLGQQGYPVTPPLSRRCPRQASYRWGRKAG